MANTGTYTQTKTFNRISLLMMQVKEMLQITVGIDDDEFDRVVRYGLEEKVIKEISILAIGRPPGYNYSGVEKCYGKLAIVIDWRTHELKVKHEGNEVEVPRSWRDGYDPDVRELSKFFAEYVRQKPLPKLRSKWQFIWVDGVDIARHRARMGTVAGEHVPWISENEAEYHSASVDRKTTSSKVEIRVHKNT
jgi:hypothetical protein